MELQYLLIIVFLTFTNPLEWPVFFEHLGPVFSIQNKWKLTFEVKMNFFEVNESIKQISDEVFKIILKNQTKGFVGDAVEIKQKQKDVLKMYNQRLLWLLSRIEEIENISHSKENREKRQVEGSGLLQILFGVAYTDNIHQLKKELKEIEKKLKQDVDDFAYQQKQASLNLKTKIVETDQKLTHMENMTSSIEKMINKRDFFKSSDDLEKNDLKSKTLDEKISYLENYISKAENILSSLANGHLPLNLVPVSLLRSQLEIIEKRIPKEFSLLYPSKESMWPYYSVISTSIYIEKRLKDIFLQLSVPLKDNETKLDLYKVHNLPLKAKEGYTVIADIDTEYLLTTTAGDYHLTLSKEDFQDCQTFQKEKQHFFCGFKPLLFSKKHQSCVIELFNNQEEGALCQSKVIHGLVQPFTRLYNGSWVFSALDNQVPVVMQCQNNTITSSLLGFGVITLVDGCVLTSTDYMYPKTFSGSSNTRIISSLCNESTQFSSKSEIDE